MAVHALKRGASDFLEKTSKPERLQAAVCKAVKESVALTESIESREKLKSVFESLTPREKEVALRVAKGELNKIIAYDLGISERTVKMHRSNVCAKLNVASAVELAAFLNELQVSYE